MNLKSLTYSLLLLLVGFACLSSCKSEDTQVTVLSSDCYISYVSLGQMKRAMYGGSTGDSVYYVSYSAAGFTMTVDQRNQTIENRTPLPYGTRTQAVLINVTFKGTLVYQYEGDETLYPYSSSDSIDCTRPVIFSVFSSDGSSKRSYRLTINVHQEDQDAFPWTMLGESEELQADTIRKMEVLGSKLVMLGCQSDGIINSYSFDKQSNEWSHGVLDNTADYDLQTLTLAPSGTSLLMSTKKGALMESIDGQTWTQRGQAEEGLRLAGCSESRLYAFKQDNRLYSIHLQDVPVGTLEPLVWQAEVTDADASFTPLCRPRLMTFHQESVYTRLVLVGYGQEDEQSKAVVWSKAWRALNGTQQDYDMLEAASDWMSFTHTADNQWLLPLMSPLFLFPYGGGIVAFGGSTPAVPSLSAVIFSPDYGLTWKKSLTMSFDKKMSEATGCMAAAQDADNFLWIVVGNQTWRGRKNGLAK